MNGSDPSTQVRARDPVPEPDLAGWFGKIPALGDFVTRRLPPTFVDPWDEWLSAELVAAQSELADAWLSTYREAPLWRFALMAGAIDRGRWYGIWLPSFDRVGRQFPLTIAVSSPSSADAVRRWWVAFVATAQRAAEPSCGGEDEQLLRQIVDDQDSSTVHTHTTARLSGGGHFCLCPALRCAQPRVTRLAAPGRSRMY